ncbi:MAG: P-II family nitrogen regulator [Bacteroidales bacterium]|nr:P-II family nitrogen regulator [Bacteroidales bacterium]MCF6341240.1 P-II family nitrogen regulator [Bacteroidales bacterium]
MKEIKAFVRPNKVNEIIHHLKDAGFEHITISDAEGTGKYEDESKAFVSRKFSITDSEISKLEMVVRKKEVDTIVGIISEYGKTDHPGDGIIYVSDVEKAFRVKTGLKNGF